MEVPSESMSGSMARSAESNPIVNVGPVSLVQMPTEDVVSDYVPVRPAHLTDPTVTVEDCESPCGVLAGLSGAIGQDAHPTAPHRVVRASDVRLDHAGVSGADLGAHGLRIAEPASRQTCLGALGDMVGSMGAPFQSGRHLAPSLGVSGQPTILVADLSEVAGSTLGAAARAVHLDPSRRHLLRGAAERAGKDGRRSNPRRHMLRRLSVALSRHTGALPRCQTLLQRKRQNGPGEGMNKRLTMYRVSVSVAPQLYPICRSSLLERGN